VLRREAAAALGHARAHPIVRSVAAMDAAAFAAVGHAAAALLRTLKVRTP
jgi:hypothetical protein